MAEPRSPTAEDVGKTILVGITYVDAADQVTGRHQYVGVVTGVGKSGLEVRWESGEIGTLPPPSAGRLAGQLPTPGDRPDR